ncbi:LOW QUALITY PROTEIN: hypothetical protein V2J09_002888 [Rumex salicifolius]
MGNLRALFIAFCTIMVLEQYAVHANFAKNFYFYWGAARANQTGPEDLQLKLTKEGGIISKGRYLYGSIEMNIKLVPGNSAGTVATFYLSSSGDRHDEIDFEFLGNVTGQPYTIHTNIFTQGFGQREQQFHVWFDPSAAYHNYTIHWNPSQIVVFKNHHDKEINFPDSQPMRAFSSLWNGEQWATQGGRVKTNWTLSPFVASFRRYRARSCKWKGTVSITECAANTTANWWTKPVYGSLSDTQLAQMNQIRNSSMIYNYCTDFKRQISQGMLACLTFFVVLNMFLVAVNANLSTSTYFYWGANRGKFLGPDSVQLALDKSGGSAITSKASFLYGSIQMRIKLVAGNSAGTVTAFYLSSIGNKHDEIDFEFLGNVAGKFYTIHTNIFTQGVGNREQQFHVWFDPTTDYHTYTIFWNPYAVV